VIDLTVAQNKLEQEKGNNLQDDMELLDRYVHPLDVEGQRKKAALIEELEHEKARIKIRYLLKYGLQETDPFKAWS